MQFLCCFCIEINFSFDLGILVCVIVVIYGLFGYQFIEGKYVEFIDLFIRLLVCN